MLPRGKDVCDCSNMVGPAGISIGGQLKIIGCEAATTEGTDTDGATEATDIGMVTEFNFECSFGDTGPIGIGFLADGMETEFTFGEVADRVDGIDTEFTFGDIVMLDPRAKGIEYGEEGACIAPRDVDRASTIFAAKGGGAVVATGSAKRGGGVTPRMLAAVLMVDVVEKATVWVPGDDQAKD